MKTCKKEEKKQVDREVRDNKNWDFEAWQNWLGFWNLLLECDMKQNPHLYKQIKTDNVK